MRKLFFGQNLMFLREQKGLNQTEMAAAIGFNRTTYAGYEKEKSFPNVSDLMTIAEYFDTSESDLLRIDISKGKVSPIITTLENGKVSGKENGKVYPENSMASLSKESTLSRTPQVVTIDSSGRDRAVLVQARARAGYLSGYADPEYIEKLPSYELPGYKGRLNRLFEVQGNSMSPTLHDKDIVVTQFTENLRQVRDDRVHIVVTKEEGIVVKRVLNRIENEGVLVLKSDNYRERDYFPTIVLYPEDVLEIWYVAGKISRQLPPPNEDYNRLNELEAQQAIILQKLTNAGL